MNNVRMDLDNYADASNPIFTSDDRTLTAMFPGAYSTANPKEWCVESLTVTRLFERYRAVLLPLVVSSIWAKPSRQTSDDRSLACRRTLWRVCGRRSRNPVDRPWLHWTSVSRPSISP